MNPSGTKKRQILINLWEQQQGFCYYCRKQIRKPDPIKPRTYITKDDATIDHVLPRDKGGTWTLENLVMACMVCNKKKANFILPQELMQNHIQLRELFVGSSTKRFAANARSSF